jgi:Mg-chelatase subunit ChlD
MSGLPPEARAEIERQKLANARWLLSHANEIDRIAEALLPTIVAEGHPVGDALEIAARFVDERERRQRAAVAIVHAADGCPPIRIVRKESAR